MQPNLLQLLTSSLTALTTRWTNALNGCASELAALQTQSVAAQSEHAQLLKISAELSAQHNTLVEYLKLLPTSADWASMAELRSAVRENQRSVEAYLDYIRQFQQAFSHLEQRLLRLEEHLPSRRP
jgi:chromosome segregation ATPase